MEPAESKFPEPEIQDNYTTTTVKGTAVDAKVTHGPEPVRVPIFSSEPEE
jgi:hypothetical protein